jgi:hypothetical protein
MKSHLVRLHKALQSAQAVHSGYASGMDTLHADLEKCHAGIAEKAGASHAVSGHLGHLRKCAELHKAAVAVATGTHAALQAAGQRALDAISTVSGASCHTFNPNQDKANGPTNLIDLSSEGEIDHLAEKLTTGTSQKAMTDTEMRKALAVIGSKTPSGRVYPVNKNAAGNPHFKGRREYPVPDLDTILSNKY